MSDTKKVSSAELRILEILWENSPLSAAEIIIKLTNIEQWNDRTVKSLITRLLKKQAIGYNQEANRYFYYPILKKNDYIKFSLRTFIRRLFNGKISPLVAHFVKHEKFSQEDIQELKNIVETIESRKKSSKK